MSCIVVLAGLWSGCDDGSGKPMRKQLPKLAADESWEGGHGFRQQYEPEAQPRAAFDGLFSYRDTSLAGKSYISVSLYNPAVDSMALSLLELYKPMAGTGMGLLLQKGKKGAVLDFRGTGAGKGEQTELVTRNVLGQSLPLLFVWDPASATRAGMYMSRLEEIPGISITRQQP